MVGDRPAHVRRALARSRHGDPHSVVYRTFRALGRALLRWRFGLRLSGTDRIPSAGAVILAANHRGVLDPLVVGLLTRRRVCFMAKEELFDSRAAAWLLSHLGGFPVRRGSSDIEAIAVAEAVLARGDCLAIFPEGRRYGAGGLGRPRSGVGRLALVTGAPVVPIAIAGTESAWSGAGSPIRVQVGEPLASAADEHGAPLDARRITARSWAIIAAQWEQLMVAAAREAPRVRGAAGGRDPRRQRLLRI